MEKQRNSGIEIIGSVPWGTHFCHFYQTKEEQIDIAIPYLKAGLENSELCIWFLPEFLDLKDVKETLKRVIFNFDIYLEKGQIELISYTDWYLKKGVFDSQINLEGLSKKLNYALNCGYEGLRLIEDAFWQRENLDNFIEREKRLNSFMARYPVTALCTYFLEKYNTADAIKISANYQFILIKRNQKWEKIKNVIYNKEEKTAEIEFQKIESKEKSPDLVERFSCTGEERYREIFSAMGEGVLLCELIFDEKGVPIDNIILDANPAYEQHSGLKREQIIGHHIRDIIPVIEQTWFDLYAEVVLTGKKIRFEEYNAFLNLWFEVFASPLGGNQFIIVFSDVTMRKQAEQSLQKAYKEIQIQSEELQKAYEALSASERHYRMLFTNMTEAFFLAEILYDKYGKPYDYRYVEINPAYELITGIKKEHLLGKSRLEMFPDKSQIAIEKMTEVALSGQSIHFETFSPGMNKHLEMYMFSPEKGKFAVIFRDITKRKRKEEELLYIAEQRRLAIEIAQLGTWEYEITSGLTCWDEKCGEVFGLGHERAFAQEEVLALVNPEDRQRVIADIYTAVDPAGSGIYNTEYRVQREDGTERWVAVHGRVFSPDNKQQKNKPTKFLGILMDITELKRVQRAVEKERVRLKTIIDNIPVAVGETDIKGGVALDNGVLDSIWSGMHKIDSVSDYKEYKAWWPDTGERVKPEEWPAARALKGEASTVTFDIEKFDGSKGAIIVSAKPVMNENGDIISTIWFVQDITELKQAQNLLRENQSSLEAVFTAIPDAIVEYDINGKPVRANQAALKAYGLCPPNLTREKAVDKLKIAHVDNSPVGVEELPTSRALRGEIIEGELYRFTDAEGKELIITTYAAPLFKDNKVNGAVALWHDITELKRAEQALKEAHTTLEEKVKERTAELEEAYNSLKESKKGLAEAQKMAHLGNWEWNILTDELYGSDEAFRIFGIDPKAPGITYNSFLNYVHPDDREYVNRATKRVLEGKKLDLEYRITSGSGEERIVYMQNEVIFNAENIPVLMRGTVQDITERKRLEEQIRQQAEELETIMDIVPVAIFVAHDPQGDNITGNKEASKYSEAEIEENVSANTVPGRRFFHKGRELAADELPVQQAALKDMNVRNAEIDFILPSGKRKVVLGSASPLHDAKGNVRGSVGAFIDITERIKAEEAMAKIEEARIKEIHHRIKNNLQVISSLLDLQAETFSHLDACEVQKVMGAFKESQNRVASMALIHEELYEGKESGNLDFAAYLRKLTKYLLESYNLKTTGTSMKLDFEQVYLDMDTAVPLGIIVNELVSNSFKHAFPDGKEGEINITLQRTENFEFGNNCKDDNFSYILRVADNGKGIRQDIDLQNSETLGLQLVNILVDQIDGCIHLKRNQGTEFIIWFN